VECGEEHRRKQLRGSLKSNTVNRFLTTAHWFDNLHRFHVWNYTWKGALLRTSILFNTNLRAD
jgi:hypothetical protein